MKDSTTTTTDVTSIPAERNRLLDWFRFVRRDLPWRRDRDSYRVWISEIMLQQTTVRTVTPHYDRFLQRFPTVRHLADAPLESVLAAWSGLGYYSRARNLHAAAVRIVADHGGLFPKDLARARSLPGIGDYSAAAVLSIAYDRPHAVLDGNVARVLSRYHLVPGILKAGPVRKQLTALADAFLDPASPGDWNQAMMELGALVCTPRSPRCTGCPLSGGCRALAGGLVDSFPETAAPPTVIHETLGHAVIRRSGSILLRRRPGKRGIMPGFWELPNYEVPGDESEAATLVAERLRADIHPSVRIESCLGRDRHAIMNRRIRLVVFLCTLDGNARPEGRWVAPDEIGTVPTSSMVRKALRLLHPPDGSLR